MFEYIEYEEKEYKVAYVEIEEGKWELIGTESLENALMPDGMSFKDDRARGIDEAFFYYVPDEMIDSPDLAMYVKGEVYDY